MKEILEYRAVKLGEYIVENKATVRSAAKKFGISKSTVHKDVSERLKNINATLYKEVKKVSDKFSLDINLVLLGPILFDEEKVMVSIQKRTPLIILYPKTPIKGGFSLAVTRYLYDLGLLNEENAREKSFADFF